MTFLPQPASPSTDADVPGGAGLGWSSAAAYAEALNSGPLAALMEHLSDLLLVMDPTGQVTFASPAATEALRVPLDERGDPTGRLVDLIHPEDRPPRLQHLIGGPKRLRFRSASGGWEQLDTTVTDLRANSKVRGFVLTARTVEAGASDSDDASIRMWEGDEVFRASEPPARVRLLDRQLRRALDRDWLAIN